MSTSSISLLIVEFSQILRQLSIRLESPVEFERLMRAIGWEWDAAHSIPDFFAFNQSVQTLEDAIVDFFDEQDEIEKFLRLTDAAKNIKSELDFINSHFPVDTAPPTNLPEKLFNYIIVEYFKDYHPGLYTFFRLVGVISLSPEKINGGECSDICLDFGKLTGFISDPKGSAEILFGWVSDFDSESLLDRIEDTFVDLGVPAGQYLPNPNLAKNLRNLSGPASFSERGKELRLTIYEASLDGTGYVEAGIGIYPIPGGIAIIPFLNGGVGITLPLNAFTHLEIDGDLSSGVAIKLTPNGNSAETGLLIDTPSTLDSSVKATISHIANDERILIFGNPTASRLDLKGIAFSSGIRVSSNNPADVYFEIHLTDLQFVLDVGEGDGFIQKILPDIDFSCNFDLTFGFSSSEGVYFHGSGALELLIPVHRSIGPVNLETIFLKAFVHGRHIDTTVAVSAGAQLGPISVSIEKIGINLPFGFPEFSEWGDFGPIDFTFPSFKPPVGAGLLVNAGGIVGGGYLEFDNENKRYAGILALNFGEIGLVAVGLITTRMPDGSDGFSLLISISVSFNPQIQLSFGFTLSAVGGLIGINRAMMTDVLREGLKNKTLDSILFPQDPILNAQKIISDLRAVFPPSEGRYIVGPVIRIGWGSPNIITAEIGIFISLPSPVRIALLGQLGAVLPNQKNAKVVLNIDILGVLDFGKKTLSIDATIYDSRIIDYSLTGDFALRTGWGDNPVFATSLGGFHPQFSPPPAFPNLRRLTLDLSQSKSLQLFCKTYFALTSNSLQFGARLDLLAKSGGASVEGFLEFDALIYFSPFGFITSIGGSLEAKYKGRSLVGVRLRLSLSGPTPWHAKGKATFSILMWDISVKIDKSWGSRKKQPLPAVDPWDILRHELCLPSSWGSVLPAGANMVETLKPLDEPPTSVNTSDNNTSPEDVLLMHPAGSIEIRQKVLPFNMKLDKLGNSPVKTHDTFFVASVTTTIKLSEAEEKIIEFNTLPVNEHFARAQFEELSDQQKLSLPSFEKMNAGVSISSDEALIGGTVEPHGIEYESILIQGESDMPPSCGGGVANLNVAQSKKNGHVAWPWELAKRLTKSNSARKALLRNTGNRKYQNLGQLPKVGVIEEGFAIVSTVDMSPIDLGSESRVINDGTLTRTAADQALTIYLESNPEEEGKLQVVSAFEVPDEALA